ncbi:PA14 domain-containing protein [Streptomyces sp. ME02-8801-2C]|uniref:fibronectin type III domain-containing protein n=1 Tax=Streptomyces sp. ME02-8801-2C TaxID=3028680 RepID=UPI0029BD54E0|nr:PA14 domain-containing protein [Streptomyces sp. ME02-8801-2C]MDX3453772.1 PA14 domain-containing protein [Streptomyces sp. ME02-8801-2C]
MNLARRTNVTTSAATAVVLATAGGLLTAAAATPASAATSCNSPIYKRQFFSNATFSGTPKKTDCDASIAENWGTNAPTAGLPKDNFSVRWTVTRDFGSGGPFALVAAAQDGIRVYIDGTRKIDLWKNVSSTVKKTVNVTVPSGKHTLRIDYANWNGNANVNFAYAPRTSATVDRVKPLVPTAPTVTYDKTTGKAKLTWAKNKEMDLAGYRIYRRLNGTPFGNTPLATTTATTYTDSTVPKTGQTYAYEIRAHDKAGNQSAGTADLTVTTVDKTPWAAPARPTVTSEYRGLRIGWKGVTGAASYRVYRSTSWGGRYTRVGSTNQLSYLDTSATERVPYFYSVTSLDSAGNESARSLVGEGTREDLTPPPAVTGLKATPTEYGFKLHWDANPAADLYRYVVYAGDLLREEGQQFCVDVHQVKWLSPNTTSYAYATGPDGEERCLFVDALDTKWNSHYEWTRSPNIVIATELDTTPSVPTPEGSPLSLAVWEEVGSEGIELTWGGLPQGSPLDAAGYRIYRWNPATTTYEKIADWESDIHQYFDTSAKPGTASYYWVTAVAADGTESLPAGDWTVTAPAN